MENIITTDSLTKRYGKKYVVKNLDLCVPTGSIYGFLGPNGAGKSTTMKMLLGLAKPTGGEIRIFGVPVEEKNRLKILKATGSLIESPAHYGHLSGRENLQIICTLKGIPESEIDSVLKTVRMENQQDKKVKNYSLGMKQRLGLAAALLGRPRLLLLDEPTNGLDPAGIQEMRELICSLPERFGMTVLVSSHLLSEIDQMATHVGIINQGELLFQDSLASLHQHSRVRMRIRTTDDGRAYRLLSRAALPVRQDTQTGEVMLDSTEDDKVLRSGRLLAEHDIGLLRLEECQVSLEDIFLKLTGKKVSL
ncbi:MAG TPA: ATP-binding cassette domain-containing protein [Candidatus Mediterraneibacter intestinavium]|nr:ATP-binding cassette domain-containing protein [Candidatus Mediterraneibacter intestinavium]